MQGNLIGGYSRRLPVYLLLDCSGSMAGDPIIAVNEGLGMIHHLLIGDPQALETVFISIILFSDQADQYPLTPIDQFQPPTLTAGGKTALGAALRLLVQSIEQDLVLSSPNQHGDYRPIVFLLTDGEPTDNYREPLEQIKALRGSRKPTMVALGCGSGVNTAILREITENEFLMHTVGREQIMGFFRWMSGSIIVASHSVNPHNVTLEPPPPEIPGISYNPS